MFNTPILFLIFNRPDVTEQVFSKIQEMKPIQLFIAADGPKNDQQKILCEQTRNLVLNNIDWECEVSTLFRDKNLGCKDNVSSAIDWFFNNVEMGIILEDDTLPHLDFFTFCEELLGKFKDDQRIWTITGTNVLEQTNLTGDYSYLFSGYGGCWGWASWRRAWKYYDKEIKQWPEVRDQELLRWIYTEDYKYDYWADICEQTYNKTIVANSWAYQWAFIRRINSGLSIVPKKNLISNIGFGENATHTSGSSPLANIPTHSILPLKHPAYVCRNMNFDRLHGEKNYYHHHQIQPPTQKKTLKVKIKRLFKCPN